MAKTISLLVTILASLAIYNNNSSKNKSIGGVWGFVSSPVNQCRNNLAPRAVVMPLKYAADSDEVEIVRLTERFASPVLKQTAGQLLRWKEKYGHPNIPLKNDGGKACQVLRRLHIQKKLTDAEVEWLEEIGFRFHSLEDVYRFADFDTLLDRLLAYEEAHPNNNFQVPKKCPEDPELGAWVTGIRRLGREGVNPDHERRLSEIDFVWKSTRKCGSKFMVQYREYLKIAEEEGGLETIMEDPKTISWIVAQQLALKRGTLSQTRVQYMGQLFGETWTTIGKEEKS